MTTDHDMTPVEVAAAALAGNAPGALAEWKAVLLAGLALDFDLGVMVTLARGFQTPGLFAEAMSLWVKGVSASPYRVHVPKGHRLAVTTWPEGFGPKSREGDR